MQLGGRLLVWHMQVLGFDPQRQIITTTTIIQTDSQLNLNLSHRKLGSVLYGGLEVGDHL